jgi:hypothetical protein
MSEWSKEHAWKVCVLQKGTVGSNPTLSAINHDFEVVTNLHTILHTLSVERVFFCNFKFSPISTHTYLDIRFYFFG